MRFILLFVTALLAIQGCKSPEHSETTPEPSLELPESVKGLVYASYPSATRLRGVAEVEKDRVYELTFEHNNAVCEAIVSKSNVLRVSTITGEAVPDSLVAKIAGLAIKGGELSNYRRTAYYDGFVTYAADYELNGVKYIMRFLNEAIYLDTYESSFYTRDSLDVPSGIRRYIAARNKPNPAFVNTLTNLNEASRQHIINNNELSFTGCSVRIMQDGRKQYYITVNYLGATGLPIVFDENAQIIWVGAFNRIRQFELDFNGTPALWDPNLTRQEIAYFQDLMAGSSHFFGFGLDNFLNFRRSFRNEYEENLAYTFELYNSNYEHWYLSYGADKKLLYANYQSK